MIPLGPLSFGAPLILAGMVALPVIWLLLRVTPPAPRRQSFPPLRLLQGLGSRQQTAQRTPWWLLLLRLAAAALVILGLAKPVIDPSGGAAVSDAPLLLVIDDGWAAAPTWEAKLDAAADLLDQAERQQRPVRLLTTAADASGAPPRLSNLSTAEQTRERLRALEPQPWQPDLAEAAAAVRAADAAPAQAVWLSDGLDHPGTEALTRSLQGLGRLTVIEPPAERAPLVLLPPVRGPEGITVTVRRPSGGNLPPRSVTVRAIDSRGRAVGATPVALDAGSTEGRGLIALPSDLGGDLARLEVASPNDAGSAAGVVLLDERWRRRPVGISTSDTGQTGVPLLSDTYYVERALGPHADVRSGPVRTLLDQPLSALVLTGGAPIPDALEARLGQWVRGGGVLIRFAGPELASAGGDGLLPVGIRGGGRTLGGVLSWSEPAHLESFSDSGPLAGLTVPPEVTVRAQVLAEPSADLGRKTWARLADGTPLVTGDRLGQGWVVLIHTTANAEWTDLPLSGVFPAMLRRLVGLGEGVGARSSAESLPPLDALDGFGRLGRPGPAAEPLPPPPQEAPVGPQHPPGYYGRGDLRVAHGLATADLVPQALGPLPPGAERRTLGQQARQIDLRPPLLTAALLLVLVDMLLSLMLRGLLGWRRSAAGLILVLALGAGSARAADPQSTAEQAALHTRLAHVLTGDAATDRVVHSGLAELTAVLARRSSAELAPPMGLDLDADVLLVFPMIYWPAVAGQPLPDAAAKEKVADYLAHGGLILFDGRDGDGTALRTLLSDLDIPPLTRLPDDHVLTRSFYLTNGLPGRVDGGAVWVAADAARGDAVSGVIIGSNDWAGAWAVDEQGRPMLPAVPGGERQREMAYRAGVNMVMYALTGNYKADQVHLPAILERLTQ